MAKWKLIRDNIFPDKGLLRTANLDEYEVFLHDKLKGRNSGISGSTTQRSIG